MKTTIIIFFFLLLIGFITTSTSLPSINTKRWRLIEDVETKQRMWMSVDQIEKLIGVPGKMLSFIDVTDNPDLEKNSILEPVNFPSRPTQQSKVQPFLPKVEAETPGTLNRVIGHLQNYHTRYCTSQTGVQAAQWLGAEYQKIIDGLPAERKAKMKVILQSHKGGWPQPSVVVIWLGSSLSDEIVVLGSHIDSTASGGRAPGADDNASGSSSVFETFRLLAQSNYVPSRTLHFHSYAAEEIGLRGSREIVEIFKGSNTKIRGMLNIDMTGWNPNSRNKIGLVTNSVSSTLTQFIRVLITEYLKIGFENRTLNGGSSDHASYNSAGYHAAFPFEVVINPNIHSSRDTLDKLDLKNSAEWIKLAIAFMIELSEN